jgi:plasmid stabilization system protein ParE
MISKIISRAACLRELASNPKSFSNCPDLHGGVPLEENGVASKLRKSSRARHRYVYISAAPAALDRYLTA